MVTATRAPELIPEGVLGVSVWVEILLDKFASHRPTERLLGQWQLLGLDIAAGTVTGGLERLEPLFQPLYNALLKRNAASPVAQADETRWMVFVTLDGKTGYRWWLWVFLGEDTVVFRLDPTRSHNVPDGHFPADARAVLMVDRYSVYKAMAQVTLGNVVLAFCWAHVRRDVVTVVKGRPEHKKWALAWLGRIRARYRHDRRRRNAKTGSADFTAADIELRQTVADMRAQADAELADPKLPTPCRKVLASLQEHWSGLTRFGLPVANGQKTTLSRRWTGRDILIRNQCDGAGSRSISTIRLSDSLESGRFGGVLKSRSRCCSPAYRTNSQWFAKRRP
jgi:transposase